LYDDFIATLQGNSLISRQEIKSTPQLESAVQLFGAAVMHNCAVVMDDGSTLNLRAGPSGNKISVTATIEPQEPPNFSAAIYETDLDPAASCEPEILAMARWDFELELKPDGRLGKLG